MPVLKADTVTKALTKKGFKCSSGKHIRYQFYQDGVKLPIVTHVSHNGQEIDDFLIRQMALQLSLSKSEFLSMVSCKIGYEELIKRYTELGFILDE